MSSTQALILFSGGQDSSIALWLATTLFQRCVTLFIDYGQHHDGDEAWIRERALRWGSSEHHHLTLPQIGSVIGSTLTEAAIPDSEVAVTPWPASFVPGRNLIFLSLAAGMAYHRNITHLFCGISQVDYSGYPDCRADFLMAAEGAIQAAMARNLKVVAPLLYMTKAEEWGLAALLRGPEALKALVEETRSCYHPIEGSPCQNCPACCLREEGWAAFQRERSAQIAGCRPPLERALREAGLPSLWGEV